jgi:hypothetical protein
MRPQLNTLSKELRFPPEKEEQMFRVCEHILANAHMRHLKDAQLTIPSPVMTGAMFLNHCRNGSQLRVSQEVSYDLEHSDIEVPDFSAIALPSKSIEFVFDDPALPGFLFQCISSWDLINLLIPGFRLYTPDFFEGLAHENAERIRLVFSANSNRREYNHMFLLPDSINQYAKREIDLPTNKDDDYEFELTENEEVDMRYMAVLAFKVLLFASIPQYKPLVRTAPITKKDGAKPGFNFRPTRPTFTVTYLPRQRQEAQAQGDSAKKINFKGRIGTFRTYRDDRFVNMKGKTIYLAPIPAPDGTMPKRVFRVIKRTTLQAA